MDLLIATCLTALQHPQRSTTDLGTEWWSYCTNVEEMHASKWMDL